MSSQGAPVGHASTAVADRVEGVARRVDDDRLGLVVVREGARRVHDAHAAAHADVAIDHDRQSVRSSGIGEHRRLGRGEPVEPLGVAPQDLVLDLRRQVLDRALTTPMQSGQVESECG